MESSAMSGGIYSNIQPGMLGLEMSLHNPIPPQNPTHNNMPHPHQPMAAPFGHHEADYQPRTQQSAKQGFQFASKSKNQSLTLSDEDEPGFTAETSADDGKRKMSPWQRMKWTDNMVRLLIMVVYYIGDEVSTEVNNDGKKKSGGVLQKKGKWKSVSRAMMERGFYVSPQQCEDKFNDLNKRYKRVNDILGKGTSCKVVENQSLLDSMDHVTPKMKEEVKKLLNSKHLFFREMCAYHNSCGHGSGSSAQNVSSEVVAEPPLPPQAASQLQRCLHTPENVAPVMPNLNRGENEGSKLGKAASSDDDDDDGESSDDRRDDDDDDYDVDDDHEINDERSRKRMRKVPLLQSQMIQELNGEIMNILGDGTKTHLEKRHWMKNKLMRLEEHRVGIQTQSFELEKQRLKWLKFSTKKEREMEREKLTNEKLKLENERMVLIIRQKELDFLDHQLQQQQQHSSNKKSDPSSITG